MKLYSTTMNSPVGQLTLIAHDEALVAILWENDRPERVPLPEATEASRHPILAETKTQLKEYFKGQRETFDLPLDPLGTGFQKKVWKALSRIPFGVTKSYGQLAKSIQNPNASRAVGAANGKNPLSIVVPCHRVIASSGKLTGFAGGLEVKKYLLDLEKQFHTPSVSEKN